MRSIGIFARGLGVIAGMASSYRGADHYAWHFNL